MENDIALNIIALKKRIHKEIFPIVPNHCQDIIELFFRKYFRFHYKGTPCTLIDLFRNNPIDPRDHEGYSPVVSFTIMIEKKAYALTAHVYKLLGMTVFTLFETHRDWEDGSTTAVPLKSFMIDHTELFYYKAKRFNNQ